MLCLPPLLLGCAPKPWTALNLPNHNTTSSHASHVMDCMAMCRVLQGLLSSATGKHTRSGSTADARVVALASNQSLQFALLTCAVEVTCFCSSGVPSFPTVACALGQSAAALDIWEAAEHFLHHLTAETAVQLAESVGSYLKLMRIRVMEDLAWTTGSSLYPAICSGGAGSCKPGDYALVSMFLDSVATLVRSRVPAIAVGVMLHNQALSKAAAFPQDCVWLMDTVLQQHLDLLFSQHLSNIMACCVYGVARAYGATVSFRKLVDIIVSQFPHHDMQDFRHAELHPETDSSEVQYGDTRQLYNEVFLPRMDMVIQERFAGLQSLEGQEVLACSSKQHPEIYRRPMNTLSAADMNCRPSRFHRMQT